MKRLTALIIGVGVLLCACNTKAPEKPESSSSAAVSSESQGYVKPAGETVISVPSEDDEDWALFLVNNYFGLPSTYAPETKEVEPEKPFHKKAADDFKAMLLQADKDGCPIYVVSAYRSIDYQRNLFERNVNKLKSDEGMTEKEAREETARNIAKPGKSEHNTGLATDLVSGDWYSEHSELTEEFENTKTFEWLSQNAYKYGFILRYPKGKEDITEITYEPWHYRYVGKKHAAKIRETGLTLEEYMQTLQK